LQDRPNTSDIIRDPTSMFWQKKSPRWK